MGHKTQATNSGDSFPGFTRAPTGDPALAATVSADGGGEPGAGGAATSLSPAEPLPRLEGYRVIDRLGEGGMGTVWRAVQLSTKRPVALKLMGAAAFGSDAARLRFEREVELTARLEHPHVARVYDSGVHYGVLFYAMELVEGGVPLDEYARSQRLGARQTIALMRLVCSAVQHAHQRGVIHRDLKPGNILVAPDGQPKVLDFGLAKALAEGQDSNVTVAGEVAGTPAYMSPEQAAGRTREIDTRSDVYSLGVILYRLLTGKSPHDLSGDRMDLLRRISESEVARPRSIRPDLDGELESILLKALSREPDRRYGTAGELADELGRYLNHEPITARPPTATYQLKKFARRHKTLVAGAAIVLVVLLGGIVTTTWQARRARQSADVAVARQVELGRALSTVEEQFRVSVEYGDRFMAFDSVLSDVPGAAAARRRLMGLSLDYLTRIAESRPQDPDVQRRLVAGFYRVSIARTALPARLWPAPATPSVGTAGPRPAAATAGSDVDIYRRGLPFAQSLAARSPNDLHLRLYEIRFESGFAAACLASGRQAEARSAARRVFNLAERLDRDRPNDRVARRELAAALDGLAEAEADPGGDASAAQAYAARAQEILGQLPDRSPAAPGSAGSPVDGPDSLPDFLLAPSAPQEAWRAAALQGNWLQAEGAHAEALAPFHKALRLHGEPPPGDELESRERFQIQFYIALAQRALGRSSDALATMDTMLRQARDWPRPPTPRAIQRNEAAALSGLATLLIETGDPAAAAARFAEARDVFLRIARDAGPAAVEARRELVRARGNLAQALAMSGREEEALAELLPGLEKDPPAAGPTAAPGPAADPEAVRDLAFLEAYVGEIYALRAQRLSGAGATTDSLVAWREARSWYTRALRRVELVPEPVDYNLDPGDLATVANLASRLAHCDAQLARAPTRP